MTTAGSIAPIWLQCGHHGWLRFADPIEVLEADSPDQVLPVLSRVEAAADSGLHAAGFLAYEAAPAFDSALTTRPPGPLPLAWFALFESSETVSLPEPRSREGHVLEWQPSLDRERYRDSVDRIHRRIAAGDTYQVNFTWRLSTSFEEDPWRFFLALAHRNPSRYAAFIDTGDHAVCSFSPELFFRLNGDRLTCRPMKGTSRRGRYRADDLERERALRTSTKERAENVMIVDMVRNDLGRIARPGSVETTRLFDIETYPTVLQMTSTVEAQTDASFVDILTALFPCASITGPPKVETMKIIAKLEDRPRGVYTGAIGYLGPNRRSLFNVAIRTVHVDRTSATAEYGTGGGIVWDSDPDTELAEGRTKTLALAPQPPDFSLVETMRWSPEEGYYLLRRHLDRLADSADFLGFSLDEQSVLAALDELAARLSRRPHRVRLQLSRAGSVDLESHELERPAEHWELALADQPIDPANRFLYHKTTARDVYEAFRRSAPEVDDVVLWNPDGELTETTLANLALELDGNWCTPPVRCGLLAGTQRAELLESGQLEERILTREDLAAANAIAILNSVRGWVPARLAKTGLLQQP